MDPELAALQARQQRLMRRPPKEPERPAWIEAFSQRRQAAVDVAAHYRRQHGRELGQPCETCGLPLDASDWPKSQCAGCGRMWARKCETSRCTTLLEPDTLERQGGTGVTYYEPYPFCASCRGETVRQAVDARVARYLPEYVLTLTGKRDRRPEHQRYEKGPGGRSGTGRPGVAPVLSEWVRSGMREVEGRLCSALWVWGPTGTGKTTLGGRAAADALIGGHAGDVCWVRQCDLLEQLKRRYREDEQCELMERMRTAGLVVVDEMLADDPPWRPYLRNGQLMSSLEWLGDLWLADRLERRAPVVFLSNNPLFGSADAGLGGRWMPKGDASLFGMVFDSRVVSRWAEVGRDVACNGPDLRRV